MPATHGINIGSDQRDGRLAGEERLGSETSVKARDSLDTSVRSQRDFGVAGEWLEAALIEMGSSGRRSRIGGPHQHLIFEMFSFTYLLDMPSRNLHTWV